MDINFKTPSKTQGLLSIKIAEADYAADYKAGLKEYAKKATFKGFRPGKVPSSVIKNMAGPSLLADQVFKMMDKEINKYLKDNKINMIGRPLPTQADQLKEIDWKTEKDFEFEYEIGLVPEFSVSISKKLAFNKYEIEADAQKIKEVHESLLKRFGESEVAKEVQTGVVINGELKELNGEYTNTVNLWLEKLKEDQAQPLKGKTVGDVLTFDIQTLFSQNAVLIGQFVGVSTSQAAETKGEYTFEIKKITKFKDAQENQEFYDKVFGPGKVSNPEEYNQELSKNISAGFGPNVEYMLFKDVRQKLIAESDVEFSEEFMKKWMVSANKDATIQDIEKDLDKYVEEFKWSLIRDKIVQENGIEASYDEVKKDGKAKLIQQYFGGQNIGQEMEETMNGFVDKYLQEDNGKNYMNHYENVLAGKVMDYLKQNVTLTEQKVSPSEFEELVEKSL